MDSTGKPSRICVVCQGDIPNDAAFCTNCGFNYSGSGRGSRRGYLLPIVGGLAILVAGLILIANGLMTLSTSEAYYDEGETEAFYLIAISSVISIFSGLIAAMGGLRATRGRSLAFSMASGFAAFGAIGLMAGGSSAVFYAGSLALSGVVILAFAHEEFRS